MQTAVPLTKLCSPRCWLVDTADPDQVIAAHSVLTDRLLVTHKRP